jgi:N-acetylmuramoyl-L-alanine amidase
MRNLEKVILHCSATPEGRDVSTEDIRKWHVEGNGWSDIGYHFVIELSGDLKIGRPLERIGAHVKGQNRGSIGVCYIGGMERSMSKAKDTMNRGQEATFRNLMVALRASWGELSLHGHNEFSSKECPSFNVQDKFGDIL